MPDIVFGYQRLPGFPFHVGDGTPTRVQIVGYLLQSPAGFIVAEDFALTSASAANKTTCLALVFADDPVTVRRSPTDTAVSVDCIERDKNVLAKRVRILLVRTGSKRQHDI